MNLSTEAVCVIVLSGVVLLILVLNDRIKERSVRRSESKGQRPPRRYLNYRTSWWQVLALGLIAVLFFFSLGNPNFPPLRWRKIGAIAVPMVVLALLLIAKIIQRKHRVEAMAVDMAQRGDVEGAVALVEEEMAEKGPSAVSYNNLAAFRGLQGKWQESLQLLQQAEQYGGPKPRFLGNKGMALWKLGRSAEALPILEAAARRLPNDFAIVCNYGSVLAELGKKKEALEQLRLADQLFAERASLFGPVERARQENVLESFRQLVSHSPGKNG
jgi:tetratricopeptide (TPR) repeat protein